MAASDEIKEGIVNYFQSEVQTSEKDWKRTKKAMLPSGDVYREFHNAKAGRTVIVLDEEGFEVAEADNWIYGVYTDEEGEVCLSFEPEDRFRRTGHIYDQHQLNLLLTLFQIPGDMLDEVCENQFIVDTAKYPTLMMHVTLKKHGLTHSQGLTDFLNATNRAFIKGQAIAPVNPPAFPVFATAAPTPPTPPKGGQPAPQTPAQPSHTLGGYMDTGLQTGGSAKASDFLVAVVDDDGEVLVQIAPMMAFCAGVNFDRDIEPLVGHLLPSDWDEVSEQSYQPAALSMPEAFEVLLQAGFNTNWPAFINQFQGSYEVYDVDLATHQQNMHLIANPQVMQVQHHHNPIAPGPNNTQWPELSGQEQPVQDALEAARSTGLRGLEQEGAWDDQEDIERKWRKGHYHQINGEGIIEMERSHALWLLYEHYDNRSGLAWPNFFGMDNERVQEEIMKVVDIELDEDQDDEGIVIIDDSKVYPAPYDMPVPAYVPPPAPIIPPQIQTSKPQPKPQKSSAPSAQLRGQITGSGSFAGVQGQIQQKVEDGPPLGATYIQFDSGEQWPEFCGAVWDNFKANGPGAIEWSDRFRQRYATIIGLGYKFDRVEFTGIRVRMGYLNDKFEIIDNIDVPGAVFDELFPELGGDWNDDDNIQMINKRKGENPETGFSYSSSTLWEEVEPMLKAAGWLPAK